MKKLFITGAALMLMAGTGITAAASGQNIFLARTMKPEIAWHCHSSHLQRHLGGHDCTVAGGQGGFCSLAGTGGTHHTEADVGCWTDGQVGNGGDCYTGNPCGTGGPGSCHIADGHCMHWTDADGDGLCDACGNPVYYENAVTGAGNGNVPSQNSGSVQQGSGNIPLQDSGDVLSQSPVSVPSQDNAAQPDSTVNVLQQDNAAQPDSTVNVPPQDNAVQPQDSGGYGTGCYGSGYGGCGSSWTGHHGSGHHGSVHHR